MNSRWDLAVYDRNDRLAVLAEVKNLLNVGTDWAIRFRRNIAVHEHLPEIPFFLLLFPDRLYLWKNNISSPELLLPSYTADPEPIFQPYLDRSGLQAAQLGSQNLELILSSWFNQLFRVQPSSGDFPEWVFDSGLYETVAGGHLSQEVTA